MTQFHCTHCKSSGDGSPLWRLPNQLEYKLATQTSVTGTVTYADALKVAKKKSSQKLQTLARTSTYAKAVKNATPAQDEETTSIIYLQLNAEILRKPHPHPNHHTCTLKTKQKNHNVYRANKDYYRPDSITIDTLKTVRQTKHNHLWRLQYP